MSDQNCLLSYLWGKGSSPVTLDIDADKRRKGSSGRGRLTSNIFIKAMCGGGDKWDKGEPKQIQQQKIVILDFAHLSIKPREFLASRGMRADGCRLQYKNANRKEGEAEKKVMPIPLDVIIFTTLQRSEDYEDIMQSIRNTGDDSSKLVFINNDFRERRSENVGAKRALKNIFVKEEESGILRTAMGDLPIYCSEAATAPATETPVETPVKVTVTNSESTSILVYKRSLPEKVKESLERQQKNTMRNMLQGERDFKFLSLCPYMDNFLTVDWFSKMEHHLFQIDCQYKPTEGVNMYYPWNVEKELRELVKLTIEYKVDARKKWYEQWYESYAASMEKAVQKDGGKKARYKNIKQSMVNRHFNELRRRARSSIPLQFLLKNKLIDCF